MDKILKLGFAMGGGVSLGTFSGASLTETIKLYVLELACALRAGGQSKYDAIELDVFSGASAGCLSLALMLRGLAFRTPEEERNAIAHLRNDPRNAAIYEYLAGAADANKQAASLLRQLVAIEAVQMLEEDAWVRGISFEKLVPKDTDDPALAGGMGILDFRAVEEIARRLLVHEVPTQPDGFSERQLLGKRVLFAASLASLTPFVNDARPEYEVPKFDFAGLTDGLRSSVHRDLRVFDLNFKPLQPTPEELNRRENTEHPFRWVLIHNVSAQTIADGVNSQRFADGDMFSICDPNVWKMIGLTAMASGAVPFAFSPVALPRWDYEYGYQDTLGADDQRGCTWPRNLWPPANPNAAKTRRHTFSFVDGGTFNNEPVREAFRLASFLDANDERDFIRRIVFVDPFVSDEFESLRVGIHLNFASRDKGEEDHTEKDRPYRMATLDKLAPHVGQVLGALMNEARVVEGDKIFQTRNRFKIRQSYRQTLFQLDIQKGDKTVAAANDLIEQCRKTLASDFYHQMIPVMSPDLAKELGRVARDHRGNLPGLALEPDDTLAIKPEEVPEALYPSWFKALSILYGDLMLDLGGKSDQAELLAIAPVMSFTENPRGELQAKMMELAGAPLAGFAGFMLPDALANDFMAGRYAAGLFLETDNYMGCSVPIAHALNQRVPKEGICSVKIDQEVIKRGLGRLASRVSAAIKQAHLIHFFPGLDQVAEALLSLVITRTLPRLAADASTRRSFELWVQVEDANLELDGGGVGNDCPARREPGETGLWLVTVVDCYFTFAWNTFQPNQNPWRGYHLFEEKYLPIYRNSLLSLADRKVCDLCLPDHELVVEALKTGSIGFCCALRPDFLGTKAPQMPVWELKYPAASTLR